MVFQLFAKSINFFENLVSLARALPYCTILAHRDETLWLDNQRALKSLLTLARHSILACKNVDLTWFGTHDFRYNADLLTAWCIAYVQSNTKNKLGRADLPCATEQEESRAFESLRDISRFLMQSLSRIETACKTWPIDVKFFPGIYKFSDCFLPGIPFRNLKVGSKDFSRSVLVGANFSRSDLRSACFRFADLRMACLAGAQFDNTDLTKTKMWGVDLGPPGHMASFANANWWEADFHGPDGDVDDGLIDKLLRMYPTRRSVGLKISQDAKTTRRMGRRHCVFQGAITGYPQPQLLFSRMPHFIERNSSLAASSSRITRSDCTRI